MAEHEYDYPPSESPFEGPYGGSVLGEAGADEPRYEVAPGYSADGEPIYDTARNSIYETPVPSGLGNLDRLGTYLVNGLEGGTIPYGGSLWERAASLRCGGGKAPCPWFPCVPAFGPSAREGGHGQRPSPFQGTRGD